MKIKITEYTGGSEYNVSEIVARVLRPIFPFEEIEVVYDFEDDRTAPDKYVIKP